MKAISYTPKQITSDDIKLSTDAYLRNKQIKTLAYQIDDEIRSMYDDWYITKPIHMDKNSSLDDLEVYYAW
jgi:hypothetical protein